MNNRAPLLVAIAVAAICSVQGVRTHAAFRAKVQQQEQATEAIDRWREAYAALSDSTARWERNYAVLSDIPDLYALYRLLALSRYGLRANTNDITLASVQPITANAIPLGLVRLCLTSAGAGPESALEVTAPTYTALFDGLRRLARRQDIHIGTVGIRGDQPTPTATLGDFCLQLRLTGTGQ